MSIELSGRQANEHHTTESTAVSTRQALLQAASDEFYAYGYRRASLRNICKACGVTTGAFYFSFSSKQELFRAIVGPVVDRFMALGRELAAQELADPSSARDNDRKTMEFELQYRRELILLLDKSEGSGMESFKKLLTDQLTHHFTVFFTNALGRRPDPDIVQLLADMRLHANLNLLKGNYSMERTLYLNDALACYADGGFYSLIHNLKERL